MQIEVYPVYFIAGKRPQCQRVWWGRHASAPSGHHNIKDGPWGKRKSYCLNRWSGLTFLLQSKSHGKMLRSLHPNISVLAHQTLASLRRWRNGYTEVSMSVFHFMSENEISSWGNKRYSIFIAILNRGNHISRKYGREAWLRSCYFHLDAWSLPRGPFPQFWGFGLAGGLNARRISPYPSIFNTNLTIHSLPRLRIAPGSSRFHDIWSDASSGFWNLLYRLSVPIIAVQFCLKLGSWSWPCR